MPNPVINTIAALNAPFSTLSRSKIRSGNVYVYDGDTSQWEHEFLEILPKIFVCKEWLGEFDENYFNTPITDMDVYASLHLYGGFLPTARCAKYIVLPRGEKPTDTEWDWKQILYENEKTIADLYRNAWAFQYNADADAFLRLPESGVAQNKLKVYMQKRIMEIGGDAYDRIADMSRIILFLLSKVELTEEERKIIGPALDYAQSADKLADVFNREKHIQSYVAHVKADPEGYINEYTGPPKTDAHIVTEFDVQPDSQTGSVPDMATEGAGEGVTGDSDGASDNAESGQEPEDAKEEPTPEQGDGPKEEGAEEERTPEDGQTPEEKGEETDEHAAEDAAVDTDTD